MPDLRTLLFFACIAFLNVAHCGPIENQHLRLDERHHRLVRRAAQSEATSAFDHSWISTWAALGDSFASGIGAGKQLGESSCKRYDHAYPWIINTDEQFGSYQQDRIQFLACTGAKIADVVKQQVPQLNQPQMVTLTIGGNDLNFLNILNDCIYRWNPVTNTCDERINNSLDILMDSQFSRDLDNLANEIKKKLPFSNTRVYWTGYAKFFNDATSDCDAVSWGEPWQPIREYLVQAKRTRLNSLVDKLNLALQEAVTRAGSQFIFVDWQESVDVIDGRWCEQKVDESKGKGDDRETLAFYQTQSTLDDKVPQPDDIISPPELLQKRDAGSDPDYSKNWTSQIHTWVQDDLNAHPEKKANAPADVLSPQWIGNRERVFHPQMTGHIYIAGKILRAMDTEQAKDNKLGSAPIKHIACKLREAKATGGGGQSTCMAHIDNRITFSRQDGDDAIKKWCDGQKRNTINGHVSGSIPNGGSLLSSIILTLDVDNEGACKDYFDKGKMFYAYCVDNLQRSMNDCDTDSQARKWGGSRIADCIQYSIEAKNDRPTLDMNFKKIDDSKKRVDDGDLLCNQAKQNGDARFFMTPKETDDAIQKFCDSMHKPDTGSPVKFQSNGALPIQAQKLGTSQNPISVYAKWIQGNNCPPLDMSDAGNVQICKDRLGEVIKNCDTHKDSSNDYWKQGGIYFRDCIEWSVAREPMR